MSGSEEEISRGSFKNLSNEKLRETLKDFNRDIELLEIENFWMEDFFSRDSPNVIANIQTALNQTPPLSNVRATKLFKTPEEFEIDLGYSQVSRAYRSVSRRYTLSQPQTSISFTSRVSQWSSQTLVNVNFKNELADHCIENLKSDIKKNHKEHFEKLKDLRARIAETKICCEELKNAKRNFVKIVIEDGVDEMTNQISPRVFTKFLRDLIKEGTSIVESFRLKNGTIQSDFKKQKKLLKKHAELSSCLRPIDFELAEIEKKKFVKLNEEKRGHYFGLRHEEREAALAKGKEHKKFLEASSEVKSIQSKITICDQSITKLKMAISRSEDEIQQLKKSINDLSEKVCRYNAPTIVQYIEKLNDFDAKKIELKKAKRREEIAKTKLQNIKMKYREQIEINKNYP